MLRPGRSLGLWSLTIRRCELVVICLFCRPEYRILLFVRRLLSFDEVSDHVILASRLARLPERRRHGRQTCWMLIRNAGGARSGYDTGRGMVSKYASALRRRVQRVTAAELYDVLTRTQLFPALRRLRSSIDTFAAVSPAWQRKRVKPTYWLRSFHSPMQGAELPDRSRYAPIIKKEKTMVIADHSVRFCTLGQYLEHMPVTIPRGTYPSTTRAQAYQQFSVK